jgi:hypothetical protein
MDWEKEENNEENMGWVTCWCQAGSGDFLAVFRGSIRFYH